MIDFQEAQKLILASVAPLGTERCELLAAQGRVVAGDLAAPRDMPAADNSAMDGFAVRAADCRPGVELAISGYIGAGGPVTGELQPGEAVKIMTGALVPPGCDAVVPVEETAEHNGRVRVDAEVRTGQHIRFRGEDVAAGQVGVRAGTLLRSPEISMLASFGMAFLPVWRRPRVAIVSTGDELVELGEPCGPGQIINSNSLSLAAAVRECGGEPILVGIALDNLESHRDKLAAGLKADVLITSAGVSAGDRDLVRECLAELGVKQLFWKVAMKPGGPTAFGTYEGKPVFSLPGNPVSTMVTFELFVRPALLKMQGHGRVLRPLLNATLMDDVRKKAGKANFIRMRTEVVDGGYRVWSSGNQQTAFLGTMLRADALAVIPADRERISAGETVGIYLLRDDRLMVR